LQKAEVDRCFKECGKIIIGAVDLGEYGIWLPCREKKCPHEEKSMKMDATVDGEEIALRKLKQIGAQKEGVGGQ
jgi:hypothetical protein